MRRLLLALLPAAALLAPARAAAAEAQWHVGGSVGYAALFNPSLHGFGGGLHLARGLNDVFNFMAAADVTYHPSGKVLIPSAAVGATAAFDVFQVVPYVGLLVGAADQATLAPGCGVGSAPRCHALRLDLEVPFGADYQVSRSFVIGLAGRLQVFLANGSPSATLGPFVRAEYVWGF
jgi:hypothetical protein